jgi:ATPase subunit of ABC transporter with duplicated ATPase domains
LLVTHDEDVLDEVATRIWNFHDGKVEDFKGTYEDFQSSKLQSSAAAQRGR